ncbi:MAG: PspC domain-containing protein [Bacteroidales bacterium]|nr:PspC domain-containing protein [Bacteroidales bacterium]
MKKTIQIHIGGRQYHINEDAFSKIKNYLESLKTHFAAEGGSGKEIIEDIEIRIAELFEDRINDNKQAITLEDVEEIITTLGNIEDFEYGEDSADEKDAYEPYERRRYRRLFRDPDNYYLGGVASGLGSYFDIDPLWIRLLFVILLFLKGLGLIIYVILWIAVPKARNTAEKLQMKGIPVNLSNIKDSVDAEYQKVKSSLKNFGKSPGVSRLGDVIENVARALVLVFVAIFKFLIGVIGIGFIVVGSIFLVSLLLLLFGQISLFSDFNIWNGLNFPDLASLFPDVIQYKLLFISLLVLVLIPIIVMVYQGIKIIFNIRTRHNVLRAFTLTTWILALILFITLLIVNSTNFAVEANETETFVIENKAYPRLYIDVRDNSMNKRVTNYWVFGHNFRYNNSDETLYKEPSIFTITRSDNTEISLDIVKEARNVGVRHAEDYLDGIHYRWEQVDSVLYLDRYYNTDAEDFWMFGEVNLDLNIPDEQIIILSKSASELWDSRYDQRAIRDSIRNGRPGIMTTDGLILFGNDK